MEDKKLKSRLLIFGELLTRLYMKYIWLSSYIIRSVAGIENRRVSSVRCCGKIASWGIISYDSLVLVSYHRTSFILDWYSVEGKP